MAGLLLGAFIRMISVFRVFSSGPLLERSQYSGSFTGGLYQSDLSISGLFLWTFTRAISVWRVFYWGFLLE